jgi:DNA-directed RNA polymerase specialized sigma24 family protein
MALEKAERVQHRPAQSVPWSSPAAVDMPPDIAIEVERFKSVISQWDEFSRTVFVLRKVYDFSHAEIAAHTGVSHADVSACLVRIVMRLAKASSPTDLND